MYSADRVFPTKMQKSHYFYLFLIGFVVAIIASIWIDYPGYMDADYYFSTGLSISTGIGFQEKFIWNYLNDPVAIPVPSHQYWMPATSIISSLSMILLGSTFKIAQIPFLILTGLLAPITASVAFKLSNDKRMATISGLLAIFSGFFLPFLVTTDTFALYMLIGAGAMWSISEAIDRQSVARWFVVGLFAGLAHISRVDGILVLFLALLAIWIGMEHRGRPTLSMLLGYLFIMLPWWLHSLEATGTILSSSSSKVLWTLSYDELFSYPADILDFQRWWEAGVGGHVRVRFDAVLRNLQSLILVNGLVYLAPFMIVGVVKLRKTTMVRFAISYMAILFVLMSIAFPFAGSRGGFFHSSSLVMPVLWALAPIGLQEAIKFGVRVRGWDLASAWEVFSSAAVILALLTSVVLFIVRVIGPGSSQRTWSKSTLIYEAVDEWFDDNAAEVGLVAINNPPGFYTASGRESVVIPDGGIDVLRMVVERYHVDWLVLDINNPGLAQVYKNPALVSWLIIEAILEPFPGSTIQIYRVEIE